MQSRKSQKVEFKSESVTRVLETIIVISSFLIAQILKDNIHDLAYEEQQSFYYLYNLFEQSS
jgi:hypothetical protein